MLLKKAFPAQWQGRLQRIIQLLNKNSWEIYFYYLRPDLLSEEDLVLLRAGAGADCRLDERDEPTLAPEEREDDLAGADFTAGSDFLVFLVETLEGDRLGADCLTEGLDDLPETAGEGLCEERCFTEGAEVDLWGAGDADFVLYLSVLLPTEGLVAVREEEDGSVLRVTLVALRWEELFWLRPVAIVPDLRSTPGLRLTDEPVEVLPVTPVEDLRMVLLRTSAPERVALLPWVTDEDLLAADEPDLTEARCTEVASDLLTLAELASNELRPLLARVYNLSPTFLVSGRE